MEIRLKCICGIVNYPGLLLMLRNMEEVNKRKCLYVNFSGGFSSFVTLMFKSKTDPVNCQPLYNNIL